MKRNAVTRSEEETEAFGESLAADLAPGDVVYLLGDLGAGKTCLARGVARGLGAVAREVASPTFAILHEYAGADGTIRLRHLDLYRLKDRSEELQILGLPESVAGAPIVLGSGMRSEFLSRPSFPAATKTATSLLALRNASILAAFVSYVLPTDPHEKFTMRAPLAYESGSSPVLGAV